MPWLEKAFKIIFENYLIYNMSFWSLLWYFLQIFVLILNIHQIKSGDYLLSVSLRWRNVPIIPVSSLPKEELAFSFYSCVLLYPSVFLYLTDINYTWKALIDAYNKPHH